MKQPLNQQFQRFFRIWLLLLAGSAVLWEKDALAVYRYCATYTPTYLDSGVGEDFLAAGSQQAIGMGYHYYEVWNAESTQLLVSGYLDSGGCAATTSIGTGKFRVFPIVRRLVGGHTINIRVKRSTETEAYRFVVFTLNRANSPGAAVSNISLNVGSLLGDLYRVSAVAATMPDAVFGPSADYLALSQFDTAGPEGCTGQASACAGDAELWLGQEDNGGAFMNQFKSVIAHELGHLIMESTVGWAFNSPGQGVDPYDDVPINSTYCSCWFVADPNDRQHCLGSREYFGAAFFEAWGHFIATRALNDTQNDPIFPYYKRAILPSSSQLSTCGAPGGGACSFYLTPVAHNPVTNHRWLETQCSQDAMIADRATEMDWLGVLYALNVSDAYSMSNMQAILIGPEACNGPCDADDVLRWHDLFDSVNAQGWSFNKTQRFNVRSVNYGVRR